MTISKIHSDGTQDFTAEAISGAESMTKRSSIRKYFHNIDILAKIGIKCPLGDLGIIGILRGAKSVCELTKGGLQPQGSIPEKLALFDEVHSQRHQPKCREMEAP